MTMTQRAATRRLLAKWGSAHGFGRPFVAFIGEQETDVYEFVLSDDDGVEGNITFALDMELGPTPFVRDDAMTYADARRINAQLVQVASLYS